MAKKVVFSLGLFLTVILFSLSVLAAQPENRLFAGGPEEGPPPGMHEPMGPPPSPEEVDKFMGWIKNFDPDAYQHLNEARSHDPQMFDRAVREGIGQMRFLEELKIRNPEAYKSHLREHDLDLKSRSLAKDYREASDKEKRAELRKQLKESLSDLFDLREKNREQQLSEMEKEIKKMHDKIAERKKNKEKIVDRRMNDMLESQPELEW